MKKINSAIIAMAAFIAASCASGQQEQTYVPSKEFLPAYEALVTAKEDKPFEYQTDSTGKTVKVQCDLEGKENELYDIEETIRILNGLELAQMQSENFYSFLEYMARQDYSMVPKEVIDAKMEILPIMQEMFILERENQELQGLTAVMNSLGTGIYTLVKESNMSEMLSGTAEIGNIVNNPISLVTEDGALADAISKAAGTESLDKAKAAAFDHYEKQQNLKAENEKRIAQLKASYLAYLDRFTPIYMKYMHEWERLCIEKDKAYLAVYSGRSADGYEITRKILENYPGNREAMLLKALSCINLAKAQASAPSGDNTVLTLASEGEATSQKYIFGIEAQRTLESYIDLYPSKAAPALVLMGELELLNGNTSRALSYFDQAAIEYPKQAAELKDMLNSYALRNYLGATPEGQYLMRLYSSTMEGYGWFSPNFHKAMYWEAVQENEKASTEVYNHFFRRDNQGLYDCLLTDMEFCETNLFKSFKSQFMESSALNVSVVEESHIFGENGVKFTLTNNSDLNLENIRLYICLHLKDMYVSEYDVFPCETINIISPGASQSWLTDMYKVENIVRIRAIMMTDDRVCWVDDVNFKQSNAKKNYYQLQGKTTRSLDMFDSFGLSETKIADRLKNGTLGYQITPDKSGIKGFLKNTVGAADENCLRFELPRTLCLIDPVFSLGELSKNQTPSSQILDGSVIRIDFMQDSQSTYEPLYLYSNFINMKIDYKIGNDGKVNITEVVRI